MVPAMNMRVGLGYDIHELVPNRPLILGGISIPFDRGLLGHSDADVLLHAVCDALLGAAGLGDIGEHFPDNDSQYKDISSCILLRRTQEILQEKGFKIANLDLTIIAQVPKIEPYKVQIRSKISQLLSLPMDAINLKATTHEKLGAIGHELGIAAMCVALINTVTR
jgi:2-C-methyl-D-erythritol 2,4-cyclodiphosphate synthase